MKDKIEKIATSIKDYKGSINSEEATKHYLILPFLKALGYDVFNPEDLVPEVPCDFTNRGDKVDYVLNFNNQPAVLIECKTLGTNLNNHIGQLAKYFTTSSANISLLTDGRFYWFFSDIENPNLMDKEPFLKFDISNLTQSDIKNIAKFSKDSFNYKNIQELAQGLYYSSIIRQSLFKCFQNPSDKWIKMLCDNELKEALNKKGLTYFRNLVRENITYASEGLANLKDEELSEYSDYSKSNFNPEEIVIIDTLNSFFIPIDELKGNIDYTKLSNGMIRVNYQNQYWNIGRIKWGSKTKYILLCKNSFASETTKYPLKSIEDIYLIKDKIIETALETRKYCLDWRESHKQS